MLPAAPGFVRKVKPLVRLGERELAAYCVLTGIDYIIEECPMAAGNRHLGYKELLNEIEERSPGTKAAFLFGFLERGHERFAARRRRGTRGPAPVPGVRRADAGRRLRVLPAPAHAATRDPVDGRDMTGPQHAGTFAAGDRVLLVDHKKRRHLVTLEAGGQFHTHAGIVAHDDLIGHPDGTTVHTSRGARLVAVRPTLAEYVLEMPRGAQVIYPKDLGPILVLADVFPGARILESGVGSGALTTRAAARDRADRPRDRLRDPRRLRATRGRRTCTASSARTCRSTSRCATSTTASTSATSTGSCSTSPSRGAS